MKPFKIICDSACDLPKDLVTKYDIDVVSFYVSFDDQNYYKEQEKSTQDFYQQMVDHPGVYPKTSMPTVEEYFHVFEQYVKEDIPVICICISSKLSGSYNGARLAKQDILEKYPQAKIEVIDSYLLTAIEGMLALELARMRENQVSFEEAITNIEKLKETGKIYFTIGSVDYLAHGGRIGRLKSILGTILKIKPIIVFKNGEIDSAGMALTRNKSLIKVIECVKQFFKKNLLKFSDYLFGIGYGYKKDEAENFAKQVKEELALKENVFFFQIGSTIAVHTGPHPIGITFLKKYDV
ncbi:MAG TPA: DegV family protein [Candidatus Caccosoma faecigallinarum]|uniref:DegV family protein n=1 Tax=Candidatus Caccosoma faecigallinarum TaxID=2840720 RepID=A0A9D1G861_9FIRM|nr:DegV family protein [Candidatus Caccosoma faecigallinarum]